MILLLLLLLLSACAQNEGTESSAGDETSPTSPTASETVSGEGDVGDTDAPDAESREDAPTVSTDAPDAEPEESTDGESEESAESAEAPDTEPEAPTDGESEETVVSTDAPDTEPEESTDGENDEPTSDATDAECHQWGEWETVQEPTCELPGERSRTCSLCGETETGRLRHLSHDYNEWTLTLSPTCTERGREERSCLRCGVVKSRSVRATGHSFGEWTDTVEVGCRTAGERFRSCSVCKTEEKETILPSGHAWGTDNVCQSCNARAEATEGLQFLQRADGTYAVSHYTGVTPTVIIPPYFEGKAVTEIGVGAFAGKRILGITLPEHLSSIGDGAFEGCCVAEIINDSALPLRVGSGRQGGIAKYALQIHNGNSRIHEENGFFLFNGADGAALLSYAGNHTALVLPETVDGIFYDRIHAYAFDGCTQASSVVLPAQLREIGDGAFRGCTALSTVVIPDGVTVIGDGAFAGDVGLVGITLGKGVTDVGRDAFLGCYKLSEVINRSSLSLRTGEAGHGFVAANALAVHTGESLISREGDFLILRGETANYLLSYLGTDEVAVLPAAIDGAQYQIRAYAFYENTSLKRVILGSGVNAIGISAFGGRTSPKEIFWEGDDSLWSRVVILGELDSTVYLYRSEPPMEGGHYWRYVDGAPMPW